MKNKFIKIFTALLIMVIFVFSSYFSLKAHYEAHKFDINKIPSRYCFEPSSVLCGAIEKNNWDELQLTNDFINKYKNSKNIIPDRNKYKLFDAGYEEVDDKYLIVISADKPDSIFDPYGEKKITTLFYFDYKTVDDELLDDIELIKVRKINAITGKDVEQ